MEAYEALDEIDVRGLSESQAREALGLLHKALEALPSSAPLYVRRGKLLLQLQDPRNALNDANTAIMVDSRCVEAVILKARALVALSQFDDARDAIEEATDLDE